jgi:penicillin-binding protein 1C
MLVAAAGIAVAIAVLGWDFPVEELSPDRGGPLEITDRHGVVLRTVPAEDGRPGREGWVPLDDVPSHALLVILASEDARFFEHEGVDPRGLARAAWLNVKERRVGYGGSTITMQLVRMIRHDGQPRTFGRKVSEAVLAMRLERAVDKRAILEQYVNRAYYGHGAYGIEAAARTYYGKPAAALSVGEATLLAVIPRAPTRYEPLANLDAALRRRDHVFGLLVAKGIMSADEVERARAQTPRPELHAPPFLAPHFVDWVLERIPADVRRRGGTVRTTLDLGLQESLERRLVEHVAEWRRRGLDQAGLVVLDTQRGEVLALVGSTGFETDDGQVNIVTRRRHPGSALKPFVYALAIEAGDSPASIAYDVKDVPSEYKVVKTTQPERGPVRYREALAGSYNLAAVHVLEKVGVEKLISRLREAGLDLEGGPDEYGLRLALGAAKVRLVDLAGAYGFLARGGKVTRPTPLVEVRSADGATWRPERAPERRLFSPQVAWLVADVLSDNEARRPGFGQELPLDLPFPVAAKTGTSRGFADTVAVAVTHEVTVAAWAGTFSGRPTQGLVAMQSAAPLVRDGLLAYAGGRQLTLPERPSGIASAEVCPLSGLRPGPACPHRKREAFLAGTAPSETCAWHHDHEGRVTIELPPELHAWAERTWGRR